MRKNATVVSSLFLAAALILPAVNSWTAEGQPSRKAPPDAVMEAQTPRDVPATRPEQQRGSHDQSDIFKATKAEPSSTAFKNQPDEGKMLGFDFYRDPLNAKKPMMTFEEVYQQDVSEKPKVTQTQRRLLESRYDLRPRLSPDVKMSRGKPIAVGPTARLAQEMTWEKLATIPPGEIRSKNMFPYPPLPHPKQKTGGQVFPQVQIDMFPRLQRFDIEFDLPDAFLPEFPPRYSCRAALSWVTCRAARSFPSTTTTGFSRTSSRRSN